MRMESTCSQYWKAFGVGCVLALSLAGCQDGPSPYRGKVINGPSSLIMHADAGDARLKEKGVEGAKIELRLRDRAGEKIVGQATSDAAGDFTLRPVEARAVSNQLQLSVSKEGMLSAKSDVYAPGEERVFLVILKSISNSAEGVRVPADGASTKPAGR